MLCKINTKKLIAEGVYDFSVYCPEMATKTRAGQFLHILCGGDAYLRRPISVCEVLSDGSLRFIFRVKGAGTEELSKRNVGDTLDILGPLGNGFDFNNAGERAVLVGGGIGTFPLLEAAKQLGRKVSVLLGFKTEGDVMLTDDFAKYTDNIFVATDDGSCGFKGYVHELLRKIANSNEISAIYTCGPAPMMQAVSAVARERGIPAQASLEERMGCGIGACVTCACKVGGSRVRVCKDGPIFNAAEVEWDG